ncbi:MAG: hypothetical protein ACRCZD_10050 [Phycicoccus sp.]
MEKATISQLKNQLSAYLDKVRAGQTVLVLDRDVPIARIERLGESGDDAHLARLERSGLVTRPSAPMPVDLLRAPAGAPSRSVVDAVLEERAEGR